MISSAVCVALNDQINMELTASYSYLAMSAYCDSQHFHGAAHWLRQQSAEEHSHAMKLYDYLVARNHLVQIGEIAPLRTEFDTVAQVFRVALEQEQEVSRQIDALYELAFFRFRAVPQAVRLIVGPEYTIGANGPSQPAA